MKTALVLGGASCLWDDIRAYTGPVDGCVACNDAGAEWPGDLNGWASLHPQFFIRKGWLEKRQGPPPKRIFAHHAANKAVLSRRMAGGAAGIPRPDEVHVGLDKGAFGGTRD